MISWKTLALGLALALAFDNMEKIEINNICLFHYYNHELLYYSHVRRAIGRNNRNP